MGNWLSVLSCETAELFNRATVKLVNRTNKLTILRINKFTYYNCKIV